MDRPKYRITLNRIQILFFAAYPFKTATSRHWIQTKKLRNSLLIKILKSYNINIIIILYYVSINKMIKFLPMKQ
jgi:hypothetical protein